jgi:leader peptidase (prepilin peptidase)/N-methyltransferase
MISVSAADPSLAWLFVVALAGAAVGSFLNHVATDFIRAPAEALPRLHSLTSKRSTCGACGKILAAWENIPVASFFILGGRCSGCAAPIPWRYPIVESLAALIACGLFLRFGFTPAFVAAAVFACIGLVIAVIDAETMRVPDVLVMPLAGAGLVVNGLGIFESIVDSLLGVALGFSAFWLLRFMATRIAGREAMGLGDVKLFAALGAWLGWQWLLLALFIASLIGSLVGLGLRVAHRFETGRPIPFGPFLIFGAAVVMISGRGILSLYWALALGSGNP